MSFYEVEICFVLKVPQLHSIQHLSVLREVNFFHFSSLKNLLTVVIKND